MDINRLTERIIGSAIAVHRELGPGLLESTYQTCMAVELAERGLRFQQQVPLPVVYKTRRIDCAYRIDLLVERQVVVELKSVAALDSIYEAQLLTYLKLSHCYVGLLINSNVHLLRDGVRRLVLGSPSVSSVPSVVKNSQRPRR